MPIVEQWVCDGPIQRDVLPGQMLFESPKRRGHRQRSRAGSFRARGRPAALSCCQTPSTSAASTPTPSSFSLARPQATAGQAALCGTPMTTTSNLSTAVTPTTCCSSCGSILTPTPSSLTRALSSIGEGIPKETAFPSIGEGRSTQDERRDNRDLGWDSSRTSLGRGSAGVVHKARDRKTGCVFAAKEVVLKRMSTDEKEIMAELDILKKLKHRHIVQYLGYDQTHESLYIYLEHVPGGTLWDHVSDFGPLEGDMLATATRGIVEGLNYLHTLEPTPVMHRDIKGTNVLLMDQPFCAKLSDFGCSICSTNTRAGPVMGTTCWMAPEILRGNTKQSSLRCADVWSLGCTILEAASGKRPWCEYKFEVDVHAQVVVADFENDKAVPSIAEDVSDVARDFISHCLVRDPRIRWSVAQLLLHGLIAEVSGVGGV